MNIKEYTKQTSHTESGRRTGSTIPKSETSNKINNSARVLYSVRRYITVTGVVLLALVMVHNLSLHPTAALRLAKDGESRPRKAAINDDEEYLLISTDASPDVVVAGSNVTYSVSVTNEGTIPAAAFTVTDTLPVGTTFVSCHATGGGVCGGSDNERTINFNTLAAETSATITLVATIDCSLADGTELNNTATLRSLTPDPADEEDENETISILASNPLPSITGVTASPTSLSPPNHKMVSVTIGYDVTDNCGPIVTKLQVASNEPINGTGDGDTAPDWQVLDEHHVLLRAERSGNGNGRTYTVTITATDSANQSASRDVLIKVQKNANK
jgi:uncharacterized repeat protein (TIGR01451 family)